MSLPAQDNFNRADAGNLGANWTEMAPATGHMTIASNLCSDTVAGFFAMAYWNADSAPNDQYAFVTRILFGGGYAGLTLRLSGSPDSGNGYAVLVNDSTNQIRIYKITAGVATQVTNDSISFVSGQVMRGEVTGSTIKAIYNGALIQSTVDASYGSGQWGVASFGGKMLDDWEGGALVTATQVPYQPWMQAAPVMAQ